MGIKMNQQSITVDGGSRMYLQDGTQAAGKMLISDTAGSLSWRNTLKNTFTYSVSKFPSGTLSTLTISALPFRHYFTLGARYAGDGGHIISLPTSPVEGDIIRITNTEAVQIIYTGSTTHTIRYFNTNNSGGTEITVNAGSYLVVRPGQTIELMFGDKNPNYPANSDARPTTGSWYVSNLCSLMHAS